MTHKCVTNMKGFDRLVELPADHRDRLEIDRCPRCGSAFLAYVRFVEGRDIEGARQDVADAQLRAFIDAHAAEALVRSRLHPGLAWAKKWFRMPVLVPAAVAAVVLLVAVGVWQSRRPGGLLLRDVGRTSTVSLYAPRPAAGGFHLEWEAVNGADAYEVRLLRPDLTEAHKIGPMNQTGVDVLRGTLDAFGPVRFWQVIALEGGDELLRSPVEVFEIPPQND